LPKEAKTGALRSALAAKQADKALLIVGDLTLAAAKTKEAAQLLKGLKVDSALVVDVRENVRLFTAMRNIPKVKAVDWRAVNTHDVLNYKWLVLSRQAFESLVEKLK
jgi:large subunit ribosomal protein L4